MQTNLNFSSKTITALWLHKFKIYEHKIERLGVGKMLITTFNILLYNLACKDIGFEVSYE